MNENETEMFDMNGGVEVTQETAVPQEIPPPEETPPEETPVEETPPEETPPEETPAEETPPEETPAQEEPPEITEEKQEEPVMYCGPDMGRRLKSGSVFIPPLPGHVREMAEENPLIRMLLVPLSRIVQARVALATAGTAENICFQKLRGGEQ